LGKVDLVDFRLQFFSFTVGRVKKVSLLAAYDGHGGS
jgi:hypothetical protein